MMRRLAVGVLAAVLGLAAATAAAGVPGYCDPPRDLDAAQRDTLLRLAARAKQELERSGAAAALVSRSGLDLRRFDARYSHAGISLAAGRPAPWAVRQLYFDCDERRARLFDQGIAGFLTGHHEAGIGYVSIVLLPADAAQALARAALDDARALSLLGTRYSANAHPFSTRYQNCNQWVAELMGAAWGGLSDAEPALRQNAQDWLREAGYRGSAMAAGPLATAWGALFVPWVRTDDHPPQALETGVFEVSMPASLEAFARARHPGAERVEMCHSQRRIVVRRGWKPLAEGCRPEAGDEVIEPDDSPPRIQTAMPSAREAEPGRDFAERR
jgi:hypothetical protein